MNPVIGITCSTSDSVNSVGNDYIDAIEYAGGTPILLPMVQADSCMADFLSMIDGLLLAGGVDVDPFLYGEEPRPRQGKIDVARDSVEMQITSKAIEINLPILAICRGIQMLNVAAGGTLYQDISMSPNEILKHRQEAPRSYATHTIDIREGSLLLDILGQTAIRVNSFHHQAVKEAAPGMMISATARDGIIEGIEMRRHDFAVGVQFHPENMWKNNPPISALFAAFADAAKSYNQKQEDISRD